MNTRRRGLLAALAGLCLPLVALAQTDPPWLARSKAGMVASDAPEASRIGAEVLRAGGNAFDAAVATSLALTVSRPQSTGLGGGGFMVAYLAAERRLIALDFRETAPAGATPELYQKLHDDRPEGPSASIYGGAAVATPGLLAGLAEINRAHGSKPLRELIAPATELAERGFKLDTRLLEARQATLEDLERWPQLHEMAAPLVAELTDAATWAPGKPFRRPLLAKTLRRIAERGPDDFYRGEIAAAMVAAVERHGGRLSLEDMAGYQVKSRTPLRVEYHGCEIFSMPPPSSGGVCIAETLNILSAAERRDELREGGIAPVLIEAFKHAFADRAAWLGDPDTAALPVERLVSAEYAESLAAKIRPQGTLPPEEYGSRPGAASQPADRGTSHFCVADAQGNVVAITETINDTFGSRLMVPELGLILNNEMDDFLTVRGAANLFGLVQGEANLVGPAKRPLSSMAPTIVMKAGKPVLVLGAAGGPRIITSTLQTLLHVVRFGRPIEDAIAAVRMHHQWWPDEVYLDRSPSPLMRETLLRCGHRISDERKTGIVQAIQIQADGTFVGVCDPRGSGRPAGP